MTNKEISYKRVVAELEHIASGDCQCTQDDGGDGSGDGDVCRVCKASRVLNRISADAFDSLEELNNAQ